MAKIGVPLTSAFGINGLSWLAVLVTANFPSLVTTSQAQPLPNCPAAASVNCFCKLSNEPNSAVMASARAPVGVPPPFGFEISKNKLWLY